MLPHLDNLKTAVWLYDFNTFSIRWANAAGIQMWAAESLEELKSRDFQPETSDAVREALDIMKRELASEKVLNKVWRLSPKGNPVNVFCRFSAFYLGDTMLMLCEGTPIHLLEAYAEISAVTNLSTFTANGDFASANPSFNEEIHSDICHLQDIMVDPSGSSNVIDKINSEGRFEDDLYIKTKTGEKWFHVTAIKSFDQQGKSTILVQLINIHRRKTHEIALARESSSDALTGLFNRRGLKHQLSRLTTPDRSLVLFYIDLDGFKIINDTFGHAAGDDLLVAVAHRLTTNELADGVAGRIGGDEFIWACHHEDLPCDEQSLGERLVRSLSETYYTDDGHPLTVSASVGIAHYPDDGATVDNLIVSADTAMYFAKQHGKRRFTRFKPGMESDIRRRSYVVQHLHKAEQENELAVHYQAIIDANNQEIIAYEALLRWNSKALGEVTPAEVIRIAEETGMINELERWVFARAISDLPKLRMHGGTQARLSINLSGRHLGDSALIPFLCKCLSNAQLSPNDLCIELTESVLLDNVKLEQSPVDLMSRLGFSIIIDDFGTGDSSLAYLHCIPANSVKIDRLFVARLPSSKKTIESIYELVTNLGMKTIVEGVENEQQKSVLLGLGMHLQQGFLHSLPNALSSFKNDE